LIGLILTVATIIALPIYAVWENTDLLGTSKPEKAKARFEERAQKRGAELYAQYCLACHGEQGGGKLETDLCIGFPLDPQFRESAGLVTKLPARKQRNSWAT
jgi:mono/diheme cytochrome c family protein